MLDAVRDVYCRQKHRFTLCVALILIAAAVPALVIPLSIVRADECPTIPNLPSSDGSQPANLGVLKLQLLDYKCFSAYDCDIKNVPEEAMAYLEHRANGSGKLAVVLDIDETSNSNLPNLLANDFGFFWGGACTLASEEPCGFDRWIADHTADAILPTLNLFNAAKAKGPLSVRAQQPTKVYRIGFVSVLSANSLPSGPRHTAHHPLQLSASDSCLACLV